MTVFATIAAVTLRGLLGRRRTLLMLLLAGMPILLGLLVRVNDSEVSELGATLDGFVVRIILPLIALVFGTAALGSELDDGTAVHYLTKPIDRWTIVLAKLLVAGTLTAAMVVPSTVLGGLLMGGSESATMGVTFAFAIATLIGSYVYVAIFMVLSIITSRGLIIGLAYALIWEGVLGGLLPGTQIVSVREYLGGIAMTLDSRALDESSVGGTGFAYVLVVVVLAAIIGSTRLARYEVRGTE
jgi:ABC-2 type transport system permease protein